MTLKVSIETIEHVPPGDAEKAINNLTEYSDDFFTTSNDFEEATHLMFCLQVTGLSTLLDKANTEMLIMIRAISHNGQSGFGNLVILLHG